MKLGLVLIVCLFVFELLLVEFVKSLLVEENFFFYEGMFLYLWYFSLILLKFDLSFF